MKAPAFLPPDERDQFKRDYGRYPRLVRLYRRNDGGKDGAEPVSLPDLVQHDLDSIDSQVGGFRCRVIGIRDDDGASWAATAVDHVVDTPKYSKVERVHLQGLANPDAVAEIAGVIGFKRLASLAHKHSLAGRSPVEATWVRVVLGVLVVVVGLAGLIAKQLITPSPGKPSLASLLDPYFLVPAIVTAVVTFLGQWLAAYLGVGERKEIAKLSVPESADSERYGAFVAEIAAALAVGVGSRCLIVDRYDRLSLLTKSVLSSYLVSKAGRGERSERWVVVDRFPYNEFQHQIETVRIKRGGLPSISFYELLVLTAAERRRLAEECGHPERAGFETVGAIARGLEPSTFDELFQAQVRPPGAKSYTDLDFFYVIAVTTGCGGNWTVPDSTLETNFKGERLIRNRVLTQLLPGTKLSPKQTHESLRSIKALFGQHGILTVSPDGKAFDITPEAGRALSARWKELGLARPGLCHLFWSLFWRDRLSSHPLEPFWIDKISKHVLAVGPLRDIDRDTADIRSALFEAVMFAVDSCLQASLLADIPDLLERAIVLIPDDGSAGAANQAKRVRAACWRAYAVIGDDRLLGTLETIRSWTNAGRDGRRPADPLEAIFLESVGARAAPGWDQEQGPVRTYGRLRAMWLIQTITPFDSSASPSLRAAASHIGKDLLEAAHSPHVLMADSENRQVINYLCASLTLWCLAIGTTASSPPLNLPKERLGQLVGDLETIVLRAVEVFETISRATGAASSDLAGLGATNEVIVLARICAGRLALSFESGQIEAALQKRLTDIARWDATGKDGKLFVQDSRGGDVGTALAEAERRLDLIHLMWSGMDFTQLGQFSNLRREQLAAAATSGAKAGWQAVSAGLSVEEAERGYVGLMANAIAAYAAGKRGDVAATLLSQGVNRSFTGGTPTRLSAELGLLAIDVGSIFDLDFPRFLNAVTAPDRKGRHGRFLAAILNDAADTEIAHLSQSLCNALRHSQAPEIANDVTDNLEIRIRKIADPDARDDAQETVDLLAIETRIRSQDGVGPDYIDETMTAWEARRGRWFYDSMLAQLLETPAGRTSNKLLEEACGTLQMRAAQSRVLSNAPVVLALEVADLPPMDPASRPVQLALSVLRAHLPQMGNMLAAEKHIQGYTTLARFDPKNENQYVPKLAYWQQVLFEREEIRLLPALLAQGAYFRLLLHYFLTLRLWGFRTDIDNTEMQKRLNMNKEQRAKAFAKMLNTKGGLPKSFVDLDGKRYLGSDFLWFGYCLNNEPFAGENKYSELLQELDAMAHEALPEFYKLVAQLRSIPVGVREALARHESRMLTYTQPE